MQANELKNLTREELEAKCYSLGRELLDKRLKMTHGTVDKPHTFKQFRRDIARIKTILRQKNEDGA